jgi:hypothetical protein
MQLASILPNLNRETGCHMRSSSPHLWERTKKMFSVSRQHHIFFLRFWPVLSHAVCVWIGARCGTGEEGRGINILGTNESAGVWRRRGISDDQITSLLQVHEMQSEMMPDQNQEQIHLMVLKEAFMIVDFRWHSQLYLLPNKTKIIRCDLVPCIPLLTAFSEFVFRSCRASFHSRALPSCSMTKNSCIMTTPVY